MAKTYGVTIPFAGHLYIELEADSEEDAIDRALESPDLTIDCAEDWETMRQFNHGNVCYCPRPWSAEATCFDEEDGES